MSNIVETRSKVILALKTVYDPEMPINIWDLGLIYGVNLDISKNAKFDVTVIMTFTSPNCPSCEDIILDIKKSVIQIENINGCIVEIVWDPPWNSNNLDEEIRLELGLW